MWQSGEVRAIKHRPESKGAAGTTRKRVVEIQKTNPKVVGGTKGEVEELRLDLSG